MQTLDNLRQRAPIRFSLIAVNVDSGYKDFKHGAIAKACEERGWEYRIEHTSIGEVMDDLLEANATPCSLCARLRRGVLYRIADRSRRHEDRPRPSSRRLRRDAAPQSVLRRRAQGDARAPRLGQRRARRHSAAWSTSARTRRALYCKEVGLPIIGCCCPACGDLSLQRQRVKRLILDLEREHSGVKQSMLKALGNVMPRHLLDTRLNPSGELRDSAALRLEEEAPTNLIQIQH